MRIKTFTLLFLIAAFSADLATQSLPRQDTESPVEVKVKNPRNVLNFYLAVPGNFLGWGQDKNAWPGEQERLKMVSVRDIQNGYLKLSWGTNDYIEIALFRDPARNRVVLGIARTDCSRVCNNDLLRFLVFEGNRCFDATGVLFPDLSACRLGKNIMINLPRYGTAVILNEVNSEGEPRELDEHIKWSDGKFVLEKRKK
ncbi:MAG: hypothetical protein MUD12_13205 [Spirochaetes bacterium]|jgi:hypothetical protein|nr:hypothetical protein [Spirochaetota bacterium]